jgi:putative hydrolase of the HAD superfamily
VIRAVTLDAAGTLFAPREPVGETYARMAREAGMRIDEADIEPRFRRALAAAPPLAFPHTDAAERARRELDWWRVVVRGSLGAGAGHPAFEDCFRALYRHYADGRAWAVFPDVAPALAALRARGLRLAVVSNFDSRLAGLLADLGLSSLLDAVVWSTAAGSAKPAAAIFHQAARALAVPIAATCHVGDDLEADVQGARAAGAEAVFLHRSEEMAGGIVTLADLPSRLDRVDRSVPPATPDAPGRS